MEMKKVILVLAGIAALVPHAAAQEKSQDKPKVEEKARQVTPLRVQVVITEYDGDRKVSSLPYSFLINAPAGPAGRPGNANIRMGLRVPIVTGSKDGAKQTQYQDVGTNLDCSASSTDEGRYDLDLTVERSSVYSSAAKETKSAAVASDDVQLSADQPVIRQFRTRLSVHMKDGQMIETAASTDPLSGRVFRVSVTLNVVK
jgi:hypothetical protein